MKPLLRLHICAGLSEFSLQLPKSNEPRFIILGLEARKAAVRACEQQRRRLARFLPLLFAKILESIISKLATSEI